MLLYIVPNAEFSFFNWLISDLISCTIFSLELSRGLDDSNTCSCSCSSFGFLFNSSNSVVNFCNSMLLSGEVVKTCLILFNISIFLLFEDFFLYLSVILVIFS